MQSFAQRCLIVVILICPLLAKAQDLVVYDDLRRNGWTNRSWATSVRFDDNNCVHDGSCAISVSATSEWQVFALHHAAFEPLAWQSLSFWINGGSHGGQLLQLLASREGKAQKAVLLPKLKAETWQKVTIPLSDLGLSNKTGFDGFWIQTRSESALDTYYLDDIALDGLEQPTTIRINVDAQKIIRVVDERLFGINTAIWDSKLNSSETVECLKAISNRILRFPGGSASDDYDWQTSESVTKKNHWSTNAATFAKVAEAARAQAYIMTNYGSGTPEQAAAWVAYYNATPANPTDIGKDVKGRDWKTAGFWAGIRSATPLATDDGYNFLRISHPAPFGFHYWEIGNECYGKWEVDQHGVPKSALQGVAHDAETYARNYKVYYDKILAVDPTVRVGAVVTTRADDPLTNRAQASNETPHRGWTAILLQTLKALNIVPHFLIYHYYPQNPGEECDATLLQAASAVSSKAAELRALINETLDQTNGAKIELAMTELNSVSSDPGKQTTSIVNALFFADAIGSLTRTEFGSCMWWDLWNGPTHKTNNNATLYGWRQFGDYGVIAGDWSHGDAGYTRYPSFYAAKLLAKWAKGDDSVVETASNYPMLSSYAVRTTTGELSLLVINKHPSSDLKATIKLEGFEPQAQATVYQYGKQNDLAHAEMMTSSFNGAAESFDYLFPAYSISVLILK